MDVQAIQKKLSPILAPAGKAYALAMRVRAVAYKNKLLSSAKPQMPCIAVGNISWGGTGKTPVCDWLLDWAKERNLLTALLSRGYGGKPDASPLLVKPSMKPEKTGDEPLMLSQRHPEAMILVDPSRKRSLKWLKNNFRQDQTGPDILLLDDAMQHLAVRRHINLVLLRPEDILEQWDKVIPEGSWREGKNALHRASAFLLRADHALFPVIAQAAEHRLKEFNVPLFSFWLEGKGLRRVHPWSFGHTTNEFDSSGMTRTTSLLLPGTLPLSAGYVLCSGVGSPAGVTTTATTLTGTLPKHVFTYRDHQPYDLESFKEISAYKLPVLCTAKDAVKLAPYTTIEGAAELYQIETEVQFGTGLFCAKGFEEWLDAAWLEAKKSM